MASYHRIKLQVLPVIQVPFPACPPTLHKGLENLRIFVSSGVMEATYHAYQRRIIVLRKKEKAKFWIII